MDESEFYPAAEQISTSFFNRPVNHPQKDGPLTVLVLNGSSWTGQAAIRELRSAHEAMKSQEVANSESSESSDDEVFQPPQQLERSTMDNIHQVNPVDRLANVQELHILATAKQLQQIQGADETLYFDYDNPATLSKILTGKKVDYVLYIPSFSDNRIKQTQDIIDVLLQHRRGIRYLIMMSILPPRPTHQFVGLRTGSTRTQSMTNLVGLQPDTQDRLYPIQSEFIQMEKIVSKSGLPHTFLQVALFDHQLFDIARRAIMMNTGSVPTIGIPMAMGTFAPVDVRDAGRVAATLFLSYPHSHINKSLPITGPTLLSGPSLVGAMSKGLDIPLRYVNISMQDFAKFLTDCGIAKDKRQLEGFLGLFATIATGDWSFLGEDVRKFTITGPNQIGSTGDVVAGKGHLKPKAGIRLEEHFKERRDEVTEVVKESQPSAPSHPLRRIPSISQKFDPTDPSPSPISYMTPPLSSSVPKVGTSPVNSLSSSFIEGPNPSAPTTTWWSPAKLDKKIGTSMTVDEWRAKYGPKISQGPLVPPPVQTGSGYTDQEEAKDVLNKVRQAVDRVMHTEEKDVGELGEEFGHKLDLSHGTPQKKSGLSLGLHKE